MRSKKRFVVPGLLLLFQLSVVEAAPRDDVLIIVNDNSLDSPQLGAYYAQQRNINPANIVHINVPDSYFISWTDFRRLRDQLIRFMQQPDMLDDPGIVPAVCTDGEPPYYCQASMDQLRAHSKIRYLVTTRGVPTRMTVDGSTLLFPGNPTSVDNYLKYWLINYFADDIQLRFTEREIAFGDGRGMRTVQPATDRELIVGRIDGLDLNAAKALVDRAVAVEGAGIYGSWYGSTKFGSWRDANTGVPIYPTSGFSAGGWRYPLGLWGEDRAECVDYLNFSGFLAEGKAPTQCRVQFNDDSDPVLQSTLDINYPAPGDAGSRMPQVIDALGYQGWLDGQATLGNFETLLNWRKNDQCTVTLCDDIIDPTAAAACRANSSDIFAELNTDCVGVADGFMAYNHTSYPVSYLAIWPTGWFQSTVIGNSGWNNGGHGDLNQLAFPEVRTDDGADDSNSLWFRNTDQVTSPLCYASSNFTLAPDQPCVDARRVVLSQKITLAPQTPDPVSPQTYRVALRYKTGNIASNVDLRVRLFIHETGAGDVLIDYGVKTLALLTPVDTTGWTAAEVVFTLDPALHTVSSSYDGIKITLDTPNAFAGDLGIDVVSVQETSTAVELAVNGSFSLGHRQAATGDHAATFLNRLGGVAAWGSVSHHQSNGCAFCFNGLESMIYFLRGLPLGDAVWFNESNNSGILYGDPLYSPVAVRLNPVNSTDLLSSSMLRLPVDLFGSTVNGRDPAQVDTSYRIDICPGNDFYACDQAQSWSPAGISGLGGSENTLLGTLDTTLIAPGQYTLRLQVTSLNSATGRSQAINDYYVAAVNDPPLAIDGNLKTLIDVNGSGYLTASDEDNGILSYSMVSNASNGLVGVDATTGAYLYRPNPGFTGVDSFTFKVNDGIIDSNIATISIKVALTNDAPVANAGTLSTNENTVAGGTLSASDVDNDPLTYSLVNIASQGTVTITDSATGAYSYTPSANATGADSFSFKVNDGMVDSNIATVTVNITAVNDPPVAIDANLNTDEDVVANGSVNATDVNGDILSYSIVSNGAKGAVTITNATTGAYSYAPNANATGADSFTFKANDGLIDSNIAMVSVDISAVNDAPAALASTLNTTEEVAANGVLTASDVDGDSLSYSLVSNAVKGTVVITNASTGAYTYTPNANATGADSFTFKVNDSLIDSNIAMVSVDISTVNDAPAALASTLNITEDIAANGVLTASDVDGDSLSYSLVSNAVKGTVVITNASTGAYTYTPDANATGADSFTFKASDSLLASNIATVTVNITAVNDLPVATNTSLNTTENTTASSVLNASDPDGDALSYSLVSNGSKGVAVITNASTGAYSYTPDANVSGADSFTFKVNDGLLDSNIATVTVNITLVNVAPLASNSTLNTDEDTVASGSLTATDGDNDPLIYSIVSNASQGVVTLSNISTGAYTYTPNANATGTDNFSFKVNDGLVDSNIGTVSVSIAAVNDVPIAVNASLITNEDIAVNGSLSASDVDGNNLIYSVISNGLKGSVLITNAATGAYSYTPNANVTGTDSFTFKVNDGLADSAIATVSISINAVNDAPVASTGTLSVTEDVIANGNLNAFDVDGNALTYSIVSNSSKGFVTITDISTGAYTYTSNANATGADSFSFKVNDGMVDSNIATVSVSISESNDAPLANAGTLTTTEDVAASGSLIASDIDGDALTYSIVSNGIEGTATITNATTGTYTYTPNANATGADSFSFKANDGMVDSNIATVTVSITAVVVIDGNPELDNCTLVTNPDQLDADNDGYGNMCDPDLNNDLIVNAADLAIFKTLFFSTDPNADFNGDGIVNAADLAILKTMFFKPPGPSCCAP